MNKIIFISNVTTPEKAYANIPELKDYDVKFFTMSDSNDTIIGQAPDCEAIVADAMAKIDDGLISSLPDLKLIHSEGVGYQGIDVESARKNNVIVCNNKGINDTAVAEVSVFLIMACLKNYTRGYNAMYEGRQMQMKKNAFGKIREMSECTVGLLGFGDIARETARLLSAFGTRVVYSNRTRYTELEKKYGVEYMELDDMLKCADFVSLHLAVNEHTRNIVNSEFLSKMRRDAYLINTARGDLVDNEALFDALLNDKIAGAGLDVIYPEPVERDNILLDERISDRLVLTPHIAGITSLTVKKLYRGIYENIVLVSNGKTPKNIVS
ncbi:MAG: 2-hydroxyacid dehydrogenase [Eubacterium sp.]